MAVTLAILMIFGLMAVLNRAEAEPLPATYSGSTHGDVLGLDVTALGTTINAALAHSATNTDSTGDPRAHAESANMEAGALGIPVQVSADEANSDNTTPTDSYSTGLGEADVPGLLDTGVIVGTGTTNWAGDGACVPDGTPIAQSTTSLAGAKLGTPGVNIMNLGAVQTSGQTTLQSGSVVSTSSGNLASLKLINDLVGISVLDQPTLTATSDGTTGSVSANDYGVQVTAPGVNTTLRAGGSVPINITIPFVATVSLRISVGALNDTSSGATGSGDMTFLRITGSITGPTGGSLASLDIGLLPLSATATGAEGGVECDVLDPPVITSPTMGDTTGETPTISGTGVPGALVTVTEGGTVIGTAVVGDDGTWSFEPDTPLEPGDHTITATQTLGDAASGPSEPVTFTVTDQTAPAPPVIGTPVEGTVTGDSTPTISGTAEPGSTVTVTDENGTVIGTAVIAPDGTWTLDSSELADGEHTITATATDEAGNVSEPSAPVTFTVDTTPPDAPVISGPADGSTVATNSPAITGTGEPGATVEVTIDGTVVGTTIVDENGNWSFTPTKPLSDGDHTVTATQTDEAGNTSPASDPVTFTVDTTAPDAPVITGPEDGTVTGDATPAISGTAEPGSTVEVTDGSGRVLGTATADADGNWSLDSAELDDGLYTITATATDEAGNVSEPSAPVTFTVDTTAPDAPVITGPADGSTTGDSTPTITGTGEPGATVEVTIDGVVVGTATVTPEGTWSLDLTEPLVDGAHTVTATQTDEAGNVSPASEPVSFTVDTTAEPPVIEGPENGSVTTDTTPAISGTGEPGAIVTVTDQDGTELGTALVGPDGTWSLDSTTLADGTYTITATQVDAQGNVSEESSPVIFTVDTTAPDAPEIASPADGSTIGDSTPTISGTGEPGATVEVTVDGEVVGAATVDTNGQWSLDLTEPLADGAHTVTATQTDEAGNVSEAASNDFTVDTTAPDAPEIASPADGSTIGDSTPTISGTGEPGATVELTVDGEVVGTATVDENGQWSFDLTEPLADGGHTVSATQTDEAGNVSEAAVSNFTVDTAAPAAPVILGPADGSVTSDNTPAISGTAEPGATVEVKDGDGNVVGSATADADGAWSFDSSTLADGSYTITATATDEAGNTSEASAPVTFVVDTVPPNAPVITRPAEGSTTGDNTPAIAGTGEPGATVEVTIDGTVVGTTTVDGDGNWSLDAPQLTDGEHTVTATQTDAGGQVSPVSDPVTFAVDSTAPEPPVITAPENDSATADNTPAITGTGEPGATVEVSIDGEVVGTATVGNDGQWSFPVTEPLADGPHTVSATQTDPYGNTSVASDHVTITVDTTAEPPVIESPGDGDVIGDRTPTISGTGEPGATVEVSVDGQVIGTATVDPVGNWSLPVTDPLADGEHAVSVIQTDRLGNVSEPGTVTFTVGEPAMEPPVITSPRPGDERDDRTPTVSGTGEPGATISLEVNGDAVGTTTVGADGTWSVTPAEPLPCGADTLTAVETAGQARAKESVRSEPVKITITCGGGADGPRGEAGDGLPFTGAPAWLLSLALLGALATAGGVWLRRRNR